MSECREEMGLRRKERKREGREKKKGWRDRGETGGSEHGLF